jgi:Soluble lytic murein transglycosylase and related regulatory proteins (some contain LysM/invasin domains)
LAAAATAAVLFLSSGPGLEAQASPAQPASGAFGLSASTLSSCFAKGDATFLLGLDNDALSDTGTYGASAWYYAGAWLDSLGTSGPRGAETEAAARALYRRAYESGSGLLALRSALALAGLLKEEGRWDELAALWPELPARLGSSWATERPLLDALDALDRGEAEAALVSRLRSTYPKESAADSEALEYFAAAADLRLGGKSWKRDYRRLLLESPWGDRSASALALLASEPRLAAAFSEDERHALAMRDAVQRREYGIAQKQALLAPATALSRLSPRAALADAGKAFLYSGASKEGEELFAAIEKSALAKPPRDAKALVWICRYYRARFLRALGRWQGAAALFGRAAVDAPSPADADWCRWYAADCAYRGSAAEAAALKDADAKGKILVEARGRLLDALVAASKNWSSSEDFGDLAQTLFRDALRERDWETIEAMADRLASRLEPSSGAMIEYTAARGTELGYLRSADAQLETTGRFARIAADPSRPSYYRALAAWRAGSDIGLYPSDRIEGQGHEGTQQASEAESLVEGMIGFGLPELAMDEAISLEEGIDAEGLYRIAARFAAAGRPDCAIRLVQAPLIEPRLAKDPRTYELLYPRPFLEELDSLGADDRRPEYLELGLIRSESLFDAAIVSRAGAVGLTQLMPSTAAEQAKAQKLKAYDLRDTRDNIALGLGYFAKLMDRCEGKPVRAMMAYNAGFARLKAWLSESGDLPDDLLVEAIDIDETRDYCKKIIEASAFYGSLYYGMGAGQTAAALVEGAQREADR